MTANFERAFIQCLCEGIYPGPANINERFRADKRRVNRLNGQYSKMRLELMYLFGVPYQRGNPIDWDERLSYAPTKYNAGTIPEWPHLYNEMLSFTCAPDKPVQGSRKYEIIDPDTKWELRRK